MTDFTFNLSSKDINLLSNEDIARLLPELEDVEQWIKKVKDYALAKAVAGEKIEGYKIVEGRSVAHYKNEDELIKRAIKEGFSEESLDKPRELISCSDFKKLTKKKYDKFADLVEKPRGKATLVPESDKRPEMVLEDEFADDYSVEKKAEANDVDLSDIL